MKNLSPKDRFYACLFFLVIVTSALFWPVRSHDFVSLDDSILVYQNRHYRPVTAQSLRQFWTKPHEQLYMPLTYTVWAGLAEAARVTAGTTASDRSPSELSPDLDPQIFHSFNLLLHVLNTLWVFALLRLLTKNDWAAAAGALLFGIHPVQVESVAWVAETKGLLSGFFALTALWLYVRYLQSKSAIAEIDEDGPGAAESTPQVESASQASAAPGSSPFYMAALAAFALALLAKPSAVCVPFIAWLLHYYLRRAPRAASLSVLPWFLVALPIALMARAAQPVTESFSPLWARPLIALDALAFYAYKIFWPFGLIPDYGRTPRFVLDHGFVAWTWLLPVAAGVLLWWRRRQLSGVASGALIFVVALLPVLGLVPFIYQYYSTVADRYLYLPMLGVSFALAFALARWPRRSFIGLSVAALLALGILTAIQVPRWRNSFALNTYILRVNPNGWFALTNMGSVLSAMGQDEQAIALYRKAIQLRPDLEEAYVNLGVVFYKQGRKTEAIELFVKVVEISPTSVQVYRNLGTVYTDIGQNKFAILALRRAAQLEPDYLETQWSLAELYLKMRNFPEAQKCFDKVQKLAPNPESFYVTVAIMLTKYELLTASLPYYVQALRLRPNNAKLHNDLGVTLLRLHRPKNAVTAFSNAVRINPDYFQAHSNLGQAFSQQGQKTQARAAFQQALKINPRFLLAQRGLKALGP